jgi:hypothetical protein
VAAAWTFLVAHMRQFKENLFLVYSFGKGKYIKEKTTYTPNVMDNDDDSTMLCCRSRHQRQDNDRDGHRHESSPGIKKEL